MLHGFTLDKSVFHFPLRGVMGRELNSKLAHSPAGVSLAMNCFRK